MTVQIAGRQEPSPVGWADWTHLSERDALAAARELDALTDAEAAALQARILTRDREWRERMALGIGYCDFCKGWHHGEADSCWSEDALREMGT